MTITERLLVRQEWYETEYIKNGFNSHGWEFLHFGGFNNPILEIAEREINIL